MYDERLEMFGKPLASNPWPAIIKKIGSFGVTTAEAASAFVALANCCGEAVGKLRASFKAFVTSYYDLAKEEYRKYHRKLPGSNRTARLRKKRRTEILSWYSKR